MAFVSILVAFAFAVVCCQSIDPGTVNGCDTKFMNVSNEVLTDHCDDLRALAKSPEKYMKYSDCILGEYGKSFDNAVTTCTNLNSVGDMDFPKSVEYVCGNSSKDDRQRGVCCVITELMKGKDFTDADEEIKLSKCMKNSLGN